MIIGLCGAQGAGKDTVGSILVKEYGFQKLSFASALKDMLAALFSWPRHLLEGDTEESRDWRETVNEFWARKINIPDFTPRKALQLIGTDCLRQHFCADIWVNIVEQKIAELLKVNPNAKIVITDCRFQNELVMIKKFENSQIWKIERGSTMPAQANASAHASETDWQSFPFDLVIHNDGTVDDLRNFIKEQQPGKHLNFNEFLEMVEQLVGISSWSNEKKLAFYKERLVIFEDKYAANQVSKEQYEKQIWNYVNSIVFYSEKNL